MPVCFCNRVSTKSARLLVKYMYFTRLVLPKSIEPSPPLAKLRVRRSQCRESVFSVIYNKKFVVCYCFDLIGTPASEAEAHYRKKINFEKGNPFCNNA